jgi:L-ascorbate metabolism protein UlaG (beta-lactamase superfamily)
MKLTWLGHASLRLEIGDQILLIDPWFNGNPALPEDKHDAAAEGATHILVTHGHGDHASDAVAIAQDKKIPVVGIFDLMSWWEGKHGIETIGFNKGGTVSLGDVDVTMVNAVHSSSIDTPDGPLYTGAEAGFMISHGGRTVYVSGDTDIMADMGWMGDLHAPEIGILCAGGHFTMDMKRAAYAAKKYFSFKTVIPYHYATFPLLEQSAEPLKQALPDLDVRAPEVMETIEL